MNKVATLIPAYNEGKNIEEAVRRVEKAGFSDYVVVVDDGSKDRTSELAKKAGAIVLKHGRNRGKGEAMKTGFSYIYKRLPQAKYVIIIDADLQYYPEDSGKILGPLKRGADFVMGYRDWSSVPFRHVLGNFVWRACFNLLFGTRLKDTNCGYIALSRKSLEKIKKIYGGYIIENSMLAECVRKKLKIGQVKVRVDYKQTSPIPRGSRMVSGVLVFILKEGLKYRLGK